MADTRHFLASGRDRTTGQVRYIHTPIPVPDRAEAERYVAELYDLTDCVAWEVTDGP